MVFQQLDWREPWNWPRSFQRILFMGGGVLGVLLFSPWWLHSWQAWDEVSDAQAQLQAQQEVTQALSAQNLQLLEAQNQPAVFLADVSVLTQLAHQQDLQLSQLGVDKPQKTPDLNALYLQQLPVHLKLQGAWGSWLNWLAQWPTSAPGATVASLELKAEPLGGISAQVLVVIPQLIEGESAFELSGVNLDGAAADPFDAQGWTTTQRIHAKQHPSYGHLVVPELARARDVLEAFPRERLHYVGYMASGEALDALVKVLSPSGVKKDAQMMNVYRVRLGQRMGQDFGKVLTIQPDQLVVQELTLTSTGEWQTREVRLPLKEDAL